MNEQLEEQAALYVLGLLEGEEAAAFELRLHSETELRGLVDQLDAAAAAVALSAPPRDLPPELRDRVLAQVRSGQNGCVSPPFQLDPLGHRRLPRSHLRLPRCRAQWTAKTHHAPRTARYPLADPDRLAQLEGEERTGCKRGGRLGREKATGRLESDQASAQRGGSRLSALAGGSEIQGSSRWRRLPRRE